MKARASIWARFGLLAALVSLLIPSMAWAQDDRNAAVGLAAAGAVLFVSLLFFLAFYVFMALALSTIAKKTKTENPWWAWVPILNMILMLNIAKKPIWWIILFFVPIVSIVVFVIVGMAIAEARGKPSWWGILLIIPIANFVALGYLAWAD